MFGFTRKQKLATNTEEFAHQNKNLLVIVCDPKTDEIFVGYKDKLVKAKIKSADGHKAEVIKSVLKASQFNGTIDQFLIALTDALRLKHIKFGNNLFQFLDGALFNISKALTPAAKWQSGKKEKVGQAQPGAIESPSVGKRSVK